MKKYVIALTVLVFLAVICGLSFFYFFHRSVRFDSDYDIDAVTITEETSGKIMSKPADAFSHKAGYGKYRYEFVANNQKFMIDIFKTNNFEHDTVDIAIKSIDLGINTYVVFVKVNGKDVASQQNTFGDTDCVYISVRP